MMKPLKIAIYSGDIPSTTFIERLIRGLSQHKHVVHLFGFKKKTVTYQGAVRVHAYRNRRVFKMAYLVKYLLLLTLFKFKDKKKLDTILKKDNRYTLQNLVKYYPVIWHHPDVFHLQWAKGINDWVWVKAFDMKLVVSLRGAHINYSPIADQALAATYRACFPKVDAFHAVSKAIAKEAEKYGADKEKITVIYSGLNLIAPKANNVSNNKYCLHIISIGRPHWKKGYVYALDACRLLNRRHLNYQYKIIGGAHDIELAYQINDLNLSNQVSLMDQLPFSEVKKAIQQADVLLLPSVEEGIANVVLEALALKTLVLSTNCGGMAEVINDGVNGCLVPIRDPEAIADKILDIQNMSEERKQEMIDLGHQTVLEQHNESQLIENMQALYQSLF
ncbi:MAG: glycosyltransferase family 4 protein [Algicola sp.]|nr:glycosyltransferase family 4 protein [Algicola sp.]